MRVVRKKLSDLSSDEIQQIEHFLENNYCTVFHEPDFNRIVKDVFKTEFSYHLAYKTGGKLIGLCPLHSIRHGILTSTYSNPAMYAVPYGGCVYDRNEGFTPDLIERIRLSSREALIYWSVPQIDHNDYLLIKNKREFQTAIIDLHMSLDDIFMKIIHKDVRRNIRIAERKGVEIDKLNIDNIDIFIELVNILNKRVGLKNISVDFYKRIYNCYYKKNKISIFVAKYKGSYIAGSMIIGNNDITHAWIAGSSYKFPKTLKQNELITWYAIKWSKQNGCHYYDVCVIEPERLPNIARFKLGFTKKVVPFYCISNRRLGYKIISKTHKIFKKG